MARERSVLVMMLLVLCVVCISNGATISWSKADFTNASQIVNTGTIAAYNLGLGVDVTVNGVTFVGDADGTLDDTHFQYSSNGAYGGAYYQPWYYAGGSIAGLSDSDAASLLGSFVQDSTYYDADAARMTLKNLTVGKSYEVQTLVVWNTAPDADIVFDGILPVTYTGWGVKAQLVSGTFTADATQQVFTAGYIGWGGNTYSNLNAVSISEVPEPATLALLLAGGLAIFKRRFVR
jgi:hypothetical protein